jgi:hypothetical protein
MKNKPSPILRHPNQEDKSGNAVYASPTKLNSSTNKMREDDVNMPRGAESDYKDELLETKKKRVNGPSLKRPKR